MRAPRAPGGVETELYGPGGVDRRLSANIKRGGTIGHGIMVINSVELIQVNGRKSTSSKSKLTEGLDLMRFCSEGLDWASPFGRRRGNGARSKTSCAHCKTIAAVGFGDVWVHWKSE